MGNVQSQKHLPEGIVRSVWVLAMVMQTMDGQSYTPVLVDPWDTQVECREKLDRILPIKKQVGIVAARCIELNIEDKGEK